MNIQDIHKELEKEMKLLDKALEIIKERANNKAHLSGLYEKELAKTIMKLRNGVEMELDGEKIQNPQATLIEKLARGICYNEKISMDLAELEYKNCVEGIRAITTKITALQTINKYSDYK